jgi:hypothetical protein
MRERDGDIYQSVIILFEFNRKNQFLYFKYAVRFYFVFVLDLNRFLLRFGVSRSIVFPHQERAARLGPCASPARAAQVPLWSCFPAAGRDFPALQFSFPQLRSWISPPPICCDFWFARPGISGSRVGSSDPPRASSPTKVSWLVDSVKVVL